MSQYKGNLAIVQTERTEILRGDVSLSHCITLTNTENTTSSEDKLDGNVLRSLRAKNITRMEHIGRWEFDVATAKLHFQLNKSISTMGWSAAAKKNPCEFRQC
jgi:hypothetical protein